MVSKLKAIFDSLKDLEQEDEEEGVYVDVNKLVATIAEDNFF